MPHDPAHVARPADEYAFQSMCLHIYEEKYHSPGASHYGRRGQRQRGKDLHLPDWTRGSRRFPGWIWVQCKHTSGDEVSWTKIKNDILDAAAACNAGCVMGGHVDLFAVATTAPNDKKLLKAFEEMEGRDALPFRVEFHTWDKLCSFVTASERLWSLYGAPPGGMRMDNHPRIKHVASVVRTACATGSLADGHKALDELRPGVIPPYGRAGDALPADVWREAPQLRDAMLDLYERAHDSCAAYDVLQFELHTTDMADALGMLAYLRAERLVGNLRQAGRLPLVGDAGPVASRRVQSMAERICPPPESGIAPLAGPPDVLASLALLVIMECDDRDAHDRTMAMLDSLVEHTFDTDEEWNARVAHAVVRFYYVLRHGWTGAARRYALGDEVDGSMYVVDLCDPRLGKGFEPDRTGRILIGRADPLAPPARLRSPWHAIVPHLRQLVPFPEAIHLPLLQAQCAPYSTWGYPYAWNGIYPAHSSAIASTRVTDLHTLVAMAREGPHEELFRRYALYVTELTFSGLLGYHAMLRAYVMRMGDESSEVQALARIERLVSKCAVENKDTQFSPVYGTLKGTDNRGTIYVVPVYDNIPPRPVAGMAYYPLTKAPFTLPTQCLQETAHRFASRPTADPLRDQVERMYTDRSNERSMACLLALHRKTSVLSCDLHFALAASQMGIGYEHPGALTS